jgi:putative endonuclease
MSLLARIKARVLGKTAEDTAYTYLCKQGLTFVTRNYRCHGGEIDLIFTEPSVLVFVEVRCRTAHVGVAVESVGYHKQHKLIKAAMHYMQYASISMPCRFDVIAMTPNASKAFDTVWIKDAFQAEY